MATETETGTELTLQERVDILREHDVDVFYFFGPGVDSNPHSVIFFRGDENEGHRALKVMQERGVYVNQIMRKWYYDGQEQCIDERWAMLS